ncbi:MAG: hypothetical protein NVS3B20_02020 [Polyangiales bacterium]
MVAFAMAGPSCRRPDRAFQSAGSASAITIAVGTQSDLQKPSTDDPLTVHEWGTFTTLQGSSGASLDGLQHESEALPQFVYSRTRAQSSPFAAYGDTSRDVPVSHVGGKMETPVIYFYSKSARHVRVHVDFEQGLLTQWFPSASSVTPAISPHERSRSDISNILRSSLEWDVNLTPGDAPMPEGVPFVATSDPWTFARETKAAWVHADNGGAERYLFYRGLGRMPLPLEVHAAESNAQVVHNKGEQPISAAFVIEMQARGEGRFQKLNALEGGGVQRASLDEIALRGKAAVVADLSAEVSRALVSQGLFDDEARAMVRTWSLTWFASVGTRVIYLVPTAVTEAILPLTIEPKPSSLVRVLVGRHEFLTKEAERKVVELLKERLSSDVTVREGAMKQLAQLGRFLEPTVRRAMDSADPVVVKSGAQILASFVASVAP